MAETEQAPQTEETQAPQEAAPEAPETEQQEAAPEEAQAEETEAKADDAEAPEEEAEQQQAEKPDEKHKRAGGFQRKIEKLERQNQILLEQLQRLGQQPPAAQSTQPAKEKTAEEKAAEYLDSLVEQRLAAREAQRQAQERQAAFERRTAAVRTAYPDFDEVVAEVAHVQVSNALGQALLTSDKGPEIMYQLAKNPAELARLSALPPLDAAREVGRLEAKAASGAAPQKPKAASRPPAPPSKVGGSATSTRSLDDLPISEYKRAYRSGRR
jgi:hypothetical protein